MRRALALLVLLASPGRAAFSSASKGLTTADFLQLGVGGRAEGMGEAYTAAARDADAVYWNPAALTQIRSRSAVLMHALYLDSSFFDYAAYGQNLGRLGAWGASVQYFSAGSIPGTDVSGVETGNFTPNDLALTGAYAYEIESGPLRGTSLGLGVKYVHSQIATDAQTAAVDAGLLSPWLGGRLRLGAAAQNLGGSLKYDAANENLPLAFKLGSALRLTPRWLAAADFAFPRSNSPYAAVGTEYRQPFDDGISLAGRCGYNTRTTADATGLSGLTIGLGFGFQKFDVDYSLAMLGELGLAHRLSLTARF